MREVVSADAVTGGQQPIERAGRAGAPDEAGYDIACFKAGSALYLTRQNLSYPPD
jgi:hypothetical protein